MAIRWETFQEGGFKYALLKLSAKLTSLLAEKAGISDVATADTLGLVKLNPNENVTLNADGQLDVGGRLGQASQGGIFYSKDREPIAVGENTFLITDALGMNAPASRSFGILTGLNINFTGSHAAGSTSYTVKNTFLNRLMCCGVKFLSIDEATSKVTRVTEVTSVTINGQAFTPTSAADSTTPIVITCAGSANPTQAVTALRAFRQLSGYGSVVVGNGAGQDNGGLNLVIGQHAYNKTGNMNTVLGQYQYNQGNGNSLFGRYHISMKNRWFMAGTGHDNTNGRSEAGAVVGQYADIQSDTLFAVGNGTSHTARSNAFEIKTNGDIYKNGVKVL